MNNPTTSTEQMLATASNGVSVSPAFAGFRTGCSVGEFFIFIENQGSSFGTAWERL
jgi:hypothetical protein